MDYKNLLLETGYFFDNEFLDKYIFLILKNKNTKKEKFRTQKHHIIPRVCYTLKNSNCNDNKENLINLLYKDHILAHYYLALCSKDIKVKYRMELALIKMIKTNRLSYETLDILSLDKYQELYEDWKRNESLLKKGCHLSEKHKLALKKSYDSAKHHTPEINKKNSESNKGKIISPEVRKKISEKLKNRPNKNMLGRIAINNGTNVKYIYSEELEKYLSEGWVKKGLHPKNSPETRAKISKSNKGRKPARGMLGKHHSKETRLKQSIKKKGKLPSNIKELIERNKSLKGIPRTEEVKRKVSNSLKGHVMSEESRRKSSISHKLYYQKLKEKELSNE